jgi:hypothetical protein
MIYQNKNETLTITYESNNIGIGLNYYTALDFWIFEISLLFFHVYITNK